MMWMLMMLVTFRVMYIAMCMYLLWMVVVRMMNADDDDGGDDDGGYVHNGDV